MTSTPSSLYQHDGVAVGVSQRSIRTPDSLFDLCTGGARVGGRRRRAARGRECPQRRPALSRVGHGSLRQLGHSLRGALRRVPLVGRRADGLVDGQARRRSRGRRGRPQRVRVQQESRSRLQRRRGRAAAPEAPQLQKTRPDGRARRRRRRRAPRRRRARARRRRSRGPWTRGAPTPSP